MTLKDICPLAIKMKCKKLINGLNPNKMICWKYTMEMILWNMQMAVSNYPHGYQASKFPN